MAVFFVLNLIPLLIALLPHLYKVFTFTQIYWKFIYIRAAEG
jgi:hypothetical protein